MILNELIDLCLEHESLKRGDPKVRNKVFDLICEKIKSFYDNRRDHELLVLLDNNNDYIKLMISGPLLLKHEERAKKTLRWLENNSTPTIQWHARITLKQWDYGTMKSSMKAFYGHADTEQ